MTDEERPPYNDEPTQIHRPYAGGDDATRMDPSVPVYEEDRSPSTFTQPPPERPSNRSIVAPLVTVALLSVLLGIGIGYLLFHDSGDGSSDDTTTTTIATTTTEAPTSTTTRRSTTTTEAETTTTVRRTTTTARSSTSTTSASE